MKTVGTVARGIRTPIIRQGSNLEEIVVDSLMKAQKEEGFAIEDKDILAITESVVGISCGNYATTDQIAKDLKLKYKGNHLGIVFPILSRNRFAVLLKGFAKAFKHITLLLSFPSDEVGNDILSEDKLLALNLNDSSIITSELYEKEFSSFRHKFTGVNMISYYKNIVIGEGASFNVVLSNNPNTILEYTNNVLIANIHNRYKTLERLKHAKDANIYTLDNILTKSVDGSGFNAKYGLLGSNTASEDKVKLFPNESMPLLLNIQKKIFSLTGKKVEIMIYGDGAFKDPSSGIWELADPVVSPYYTDGLEGSPNELKLKLLVDKEFSNLKGTNLDDAITEAIKHKSKDLVGNQASLGTTPRRYVDLIGSLCDLMSGSGDKGTPVIYIQNYFKNYTE